MDEKKAGKYVYVRRFRKDFNFNSLQMSLILVIFTIITLISIWLPAYIASLPLSGS